MPQDRLRSVRSRMVPMALRRTRTGITGKGERGGGGMTMTKAIIKTIPTGIDVRFGYDDTPETFSRRAEK